MSRSGFVLLLAAAGVPGWAVPVAAAEPSAPVPRLAAKSTEVFLFNRTACDLTSRRITMRSGTVTRQSGESSVPPGGASAWATAPNWRGKIEGAATFQTANCTDSARDIRVTWENPLVGQNSYGSAGTDGRFTVGYTGGRGVSATVYFTVRPAS